MTLTLNDTCDELLITSSYQDNANQSVTLTVTANCGTAYPDIDVDVTEGSYNLLPTALGLDSFEKGVHTIKLVTVQAEGDVVPEIKCIVIDCALNCDMLDVFLDLEGNDENMVRALSYHALSAIADCNTCTCSDWCTLYNAATNQSCVEDAQPCGCS